MSPRRGRTGLAADQATASNVGSMSSSLSISSSILDGGFVWQEAGERQPLPVGEQPASPASAGWSVPVFGFVGRAMIGLAVLASVGWAVGTINLNEQNAPTPMAAAPDPITTGSIRPVLPPTIGTGEEERTKALARASALSSRQDGVGRRAVNMMCTACGIPSPPAPISDGR
jgi:hypothetical protein